MGSKDLVENLARSGGLKGRKACGDGDEVLGGLRGQIKSIVARPV